MKRTKEYESILKNIIEGELIQCSENDPQFPLFEALLQEGLISCNDDSRYLGVVSEYKRLEERKYHKIVPTVKGILLYENLRKDNFWGKSINWFFGWLVVLLSTLISSAVYGHMIDPWISKLTTSIETSSQGETKSPENPRPNKTPEPSTISPKQTPK